MKHYKDGVYIGADDEDYVKVNSTTELEQAIRWLEQELEYYENFGDIPNNSESIADFRVLLDALRENERLNADMKELIAGNETIHSIIDGTITISGDMISMIRIGLVDMFRSSGATNFLIQNLKDPKTGEEFTMNIQKTDALLPEQKYITAQAENERLKAKLDAVRAECNKSRQSGRRLSALQLLDIIGKDGDT